MTPDKALATLADVARLLGTQRGELLRQATRDLSKAGSVLRAALAAPEQEAPLPLYADLAAIPAPYRAHALSYARAVIRDALAPQPKGTRPLTEPALVAWVVERWHAEVANRPLVNVNRRPLDDCWRQMLRHLGGDDIALLGPRHDDLVSAAPRPLVAEPPVAFGYWNKRLGWYGLSLQPGGSYTAEDRRPLYAAPASLSPAPSITPEPDFRQQFSRLFRCGDDAPWETILRVAEIAVSALRRPAPDASSTVAPAWEPYAPEQFAADAKRSVDAALEPGPRLEHGPGGGQSWGPPGPLGDGG